MVLHGLGLILLIPFFYGQALLENESHTPFWAGPQKPICNTLHIQEPRI